MRKGGSCALLDEQLQGGERKKQSTEPKILAFQTTTSYLVKEAVLLSIRTHSSLLRVRVKPRRLYLNLMLCLLIPIKYLT